jgi:transposase
LGQHDRSEALFYYFRLEDHVPETHLLRLLEKHISFAFVREQLKDSYRETGRPSVDPELLLRMLLIGYLYGIFEARSAAYYQVSTELAAQRNVDMKRAKSDLEEHQLVCVSGARARQS